MRSKLAREASAGAPSASASSPAARKAPLPPPLIEGATNARIGLASAIVTSDRTSNFALCSGRNRTVPPNVAPGPVAVKLLTSTAPVAGS